MAPTSQLSSDPQRYLNGMEYLVEVVQRLSLARTLEAVTEIVRSAARRLTGADGATFVLKDGQKCYYVDEDAIGPLWKGKRFPLETCISGWAMAHRQSVAIEDIYQDPRIPIDAYRPTFVKSLVMVPIRSEAPLGAIGNYWAGPHPVAPEEVKLLQALAHATSAALENVQHYTELQRQISLRDEFISIAAHELKTPLTPLSVQWHLAEKRASDSKISDADFRESSRKMITNAKRQVDGLSRLVESLLDASRFRLGEFHYEFTDGVSLREILEGVIEQQRFTGSTLISLVLENDVRGRWDRTRLEQAFRNMLQNAVKYGEGKPIVLTVDTMPDRVRVHVRDEGIGIAEADQERIFEHFERAVSFKRFGGMGLGLYITRKILQGHGGSITVSSQAGRGSIFTAELPLVSGEVGSVE